MTRNLKIEIEVGDGAVTAFFTKTPGIRATAPTDREALDALAKAGTAYVRNGGNADDLVVISKEQSAA